MLSLSQTTGYAIKALGCLNEPSHHCRLIADVAKCAEIPKPYLAKIINSLARHGLVSAKRGYKGGISLTRRADDISLLEIVEAVEGKEWIGACLLGLEECSDQKTCPTHAFWQRIRAEITEVLRTTTLAEIITVREQDVRARQRTKLNRQRATGACAFRAGRRACLSGS
jgi:Rrf2 family transcriptional regulator, iron-sulfur cluster assembly transcription factor